MPEDRFNGKDATEEKKRFQERKKEINEAIEAGNWEAVGSLAVMTSADSFTWKSPDELDNLDSEKDSFLAEGNSFSHLEHHDTETPQQGPSSNAANTSSNVANLEEMEDPSNFFVQIHDGNQDSSETTRPTQRWIILILICVVMTGIYYSLDIPAALHQELQDYMPPNQKFEIRFNLLYSVYSIPNMILPFFAGTIVDRLGASQCLFGCAGLALVGQFLFAIGTTQRNWWIMLLGRTVYGFGGESSCVAYSTLLSSWFAGGEVAFSFGVAIAISRLGSVFNNFLSPHVAHKATTPWALWTGVILNSISTIVAFLILYIDQRHSSRLRRENERETSLSEPLLSAREKGEQENEEGQQNKPVHVSDVLRFGPLFWLLSISCLVVYGCVLPFNNVASGILMEHNYFKKPPGDCKLPFPDQCTSGSLQDHTNDSIDSNGNTCPSHNFAPVIPTSLNVTDPKDNSTHVVDSLSSKDIDCNHQFWALGCTKDYCDAEQAATEKAGRVMSIPYFMSSILSPILGHVVDKIGKRAILASLSSLVLVFVHLLLGLTVVPPTVPLVGQGIAYALYAAVLWPSVPLTVEESVTGTAFGVIVSVQNVGLSLFPLVIAAIYNADGNKYIPFVELFFVACALVGFSVGVLMNVLDRRSGNKLNSVRNDDEHGSLRSQDSIFSDVNEEIF